MVRSLLVLACVLPVCVGCTRAPAAPAATEPDTTLVQPDNDLAGTVWVGTIDNANAEGVRTGVTWHFLSGGRLRHVRSWDKNEQAGTWKLEDGSVVVRIGTYGEAGQYGTIDLERKGDAMKGETRWRSGYGVGWEFELDRTK